MLKKLKTFFAILTLSFSFVSPALAVVPAHAATVDPKQQACEALGGASSGTSGGTCATPAAGPDVDKTLKLGINAFSLIIGVTAVIMIMVGGMKYVLSNGDSGNVNSAKNTILYALIGLVVVALAQIVVRYVLNRTA